MNQLPRALRTLSVLFIVAILLPVRPIALAQTASPTQRYVAITGADTGDCADSAVPCRTIQYAIDRAVAGRILRASPFPAP